MSRPPYEKDQFVGRTDIIEEVRQWLARPTSRRLLSIVGSPGIGKSWLLGKLQDELQANHIILWPAQDDLSNEINQLFWIKNQIEVVKVSQLCKGNIREYYGDDSFRAKFDALVEDLCQRCRPRGVPILFFDGFDEINENDRIWVEEQLLKPFLSPDCTRVILARRKNIHLQVGYLRWRHKMLEIKTFTPTEGDNHKTSAGPPDVEFPQSLDDYKWEHPWLNYQLFKAYFENQMLSKSDVKQAIQNLIEPKTISDDAFKLLVLLSTRGPEWTDRDLKAWLNELDNFSLFEYLPELIHSGIVQETSGPYRKVGDGIRELTRAWQILKEREEE